MQMPNTSYLYANKEFRNRTTDKRETNESDTEKIKTIICQINYYFAESIADSPVTVPVTVHVPMYFIPTPLYDAEEKITNQSPVGTVSLYVKHEKSYDGEPSINTYIELKTPEGSEYQSLMELVNKDNTTAYYVRPEIQALIVNWPQIKKEYDATRDRIVGEYEKNVQPAIQNFNLYPGRPLVKENEAEELDENVIE